MTWGFAKTKHLWGLFGVLRPFTTANFCHFLQNRDMVWAASACSGLLWRDLWEVLWEWMRKSLLGKRCDSPIGRALRKFACDSARRKRMRKSPTTQARWKWVRERSLRLGMMSAIGDELFDWIRWVRLKESRFIVRISARQQRTAPCLSRKKQGAVRLDV